jgi:hypothetical protein
MYVATNFAMRARHSHPKQLKKIFDRYVFVQKFSGSGWDDDAKHATNTEEYVDDFVKVRRHVNEHGGLLTVPDIWRRLFALLYYRMSLLGRTGCSL